MKQKSKRATLIEFIREHVVPELLSLGFSQQDLQTRDEDSPRYYPLKCFKRDRDGNLDLILFQFDKYGDPKFHIRLGVIPEGYELVFETYNEQYYQKDISIFEAPNYANLNSSKHSVKHFYVPIFLKPTPARLEKLALKVKKHIDDIDIYLKTNKKSPYITSYPLPHGKSAQYFINGKPVKTN